MARVLGFRSIGSHMALGTRAYWGRLGGFPRLRIRTAECCLFPSHTGPARRQSLIRVIHGRKGTKPAGFARSRRSAMGVGCRLLGFAVQLHSKGMLPRGYRAHNSDNPSLQSKRRVSGYVMLFTLLILYSGTP